jgi:hypothetical protein
MITTEASRRSSSSEAASATSATSARAIRPLPTSLPPTASDRFT